MTGVTGEYGGGGGVVALYWDAEAFGGELSAM